MPQATPSERASAELKLRERQKATVARLPRPTNRKELKEAIKSLIGVELPDTAVCAGHCSPFDAVADAYFADKSDMAVWKASRGFGGKSLALAVLSFMEAVTLTASVSLLGGSGKQSQNVHNYINGQHENIPDTFWKWPKAPRHLLVSDPTHFTTRLTNKGKITVLMASQTSVRGPHPQRLRIDEVDEVDVSIIDAALGQPMEARGIREHTVFSSTHQYPDGAMSEVLERAAEKHWPVYEWCYRESMAGGWLSQAQIDRKRAAVTKLMWDTEYELQEPDPGAMAIQRESVEAMFDESLGRVAGDVGRYYEFEPPEQGALYCTGADWAKRQDWTIIVTVRIDTQPMRVVAFERDGRKKWPLMVDKLHKRMKRYPHPLVRLADWPASQPPIFLAGHDTTGLGDVIHDYLKVSIMPVLMVGRQRKDQLSNYIAAVEHGQYVSPMIEFMYKEHRKASRDHVYGTGHLPDTISAMSCLHKAVSAPIKLVQQKYDPVKIGVFA